MGGAGGDAAWGGLLAGNSVGVPNACAGEGASEGGGDGGGGEGSEADAGDLHDVGAGNGVGPAHDGGAAPTSGRINVTFKQTVIEDAMASMDAMVQLTRQPVVPPSRGKRKVGSVNGRRTDDNDAPTPQQYKYTTVTTEVRSFYEEKQDWRRAEPLLKRRKTCKPGRFNSVRLRALQSYALTGRPGGFSLSEQERLFDLLDTWDRTRPGMAVDDGHDQTVRDAFKTVNGFKDALRDDIDAAVLQEGWSKCSLEEGGVVYEAYFRSVLEVALKMLQDCKDVKLWSGGDRPAPPTNNRESPLDGDAFRLCEMTVMDEHGPDSFVLAFHVFSDASQLAWSGGKSTYF